VYTRRARYRSVPCLPLIKQTRLIGVLYLENNLAPHVFTPARIALLDLLASQAAISLGTVRLYADLRHTEAYLEEAPRLSHTGSFGWRVSRSEIFWSDETFGIVAFDRGTRPTLERILARVYPDRTSLGRNDWELEHRLLMPDGSVKNLHVVARAMLDDAGEAEFFGTVMDITDRKRADALRNAQADLARVSRLTTIGELTASVAHEVNQPLMGTVTNASACVQWL
jgi:signal transduction histidine kinase